MEKLCLPKLGDSNPFSIELGEIPHTSETSHEPEAKTNKKLLRLIAVSEFVKRGWFIPIFLCASFRLFKYHPEHVVLNQGRKKALRSIVVVLLIIVSIIFQLLFFSIFFVDLCIYRPILFIKIQTEMKGTGVTHQTNSNHSFFPSLSPSTRLFREYEDWFLFIWDYLYGLVGLYSTAFLFLHSWTLPTDDYPGIVNLIRNIMKNKVEMFAPNSHINRISPVCLFRGLYKFVSCSDNRTEKCISTLFSGIAYSFVIVSSLILVVYWITLNVIGRYFNTESEDSLSQDSNVFLLFIFIDTFHWHLAPVVICFLIRFSCMEMYTAIDKLRFTYVRKLIRHANNRESSVLEPSVDLWREFYTILNRVSIISLRYGRICAININVLIFSVLAISLHYIDQQIVTIDRFIKYDWVDASRFLVWYLVHWISVWFMVDAMATLNSTIRLFPDEILISFAKYSSIELSNEIQNQLNLCRQTQKRFCIHFFGAVNRATVHVILASGGATLLIFGFEALKILFKIIKIQ